MAEPPDPMPADAGRGHLRASHADRERVIGVLKAAYVQGMLGKDEFDRRVSQTFASRTYADLAALTTDLPAGLAAVQPQPEVARTRARPPVRKIGIGAALIGPSPAILAAAFFSGSELLLDWLILVTFLWVWVWVAGGAAVLISWRDKRSGGQSPRRPAPGARGQAPRRLPSAGPGRQLPPAVSSLWTAVGIMACAVVTSLDQRPSRRQRPPRPAADGHALEAEPHAGAGHGPVPPGPRTDRPRADLQARKPPQHRQHIFPRAGRAPRGARPAPGAV